ncbi:MAG: hypothetical protein IPL28_15895 [Chloroflexi bacterium]|nr:hypothetical protein [Chloroflexota bacterium]
MRRYLLPFFVFTLLTAVVRPVWASPASYTWGSFDTTGAAVGFIGLDGEPLPQNSVVQLIWVGPDGEINPPHPYTGQPSGDDVLLEARAVLTNSQVPAPFRSKGYVALDEYSYDTQDGWAGQMVYMRGWNGTAAGRQGDATAYGDSGPLLLNNGGTGNLLGIQTDQQVSAVSLQQLQTNHKGNSYWLLVISYWLLVISYWRVRQPNNN